VTPASHHTPTARRQQARQAAVRARQHSTLTGPHLTTPQPVGAGLGTGALDDSGFGAPTGGGVRTGPTDSMTSRGAHGVASYTNHPPGTCRTFRATSPRA